MGRTALYRDPIPFKPARAEVQLEPDAVLFEMPDGQLRRHTLDGCTPTTMDAFVAARGDARNDGPAWARPAATPVARHERRFVRMLVLEHGNARHFVITPPDQGAVAPNVVRMPEAPSEAAIIDSRAWDTIADWVLGGGRLGAFSIAELARLAAIASPHFAIVIGEVAAQRALEQLWVMAGPLRGGFETLAGDGTEVTLRPLVEAARSSPRAADALVSALAYLAGSQRRRRRW